MSREIYVEHPTIEISGAQQPAATYEWKDPAVSASLLPCLGERISSISVDGGRLSIRFTNGMHLGVDPDEQFESWQINSEDGLLIVCLPGGDLSEWYRSDA